MIFFILFVLVSIYLQEFYVAVCVCMWVGETYKNVLYSESIEGRDLSQVLDS